MKTKIFAGLCLGLALSACFFAPARVYADPLSPAMLNSSARAMCVVEAESGRVLYGKNYTEPLAMASTTKIFTALTVLENCDNLEEMVEVDDRAVGIEGTSIYLRKGEVLSVKELLLGMMLPSGNDAATALAYYVGGSVENFCKMMDETAKNAGATGSSFKNAHGLDEKGHYTTAKDLALVSAKALQNDDFCEIVGTKSAVISGNKEVKSRYLKNKNRLLKSFEGCTGIKTGFTDNAGRCFVSSATQNDMTVVCTVLNCGDMFEECTRLMQKAFDNFEMTEIVEDYGALGSIEVEKGRASSVKLFSRKKFAFPLTSEERLRLEVVRNLPERLVAPVIKEQIVGKISVYLDGTKLFEDDVLCRDEVKSKSILSFAYDVIKNWH